MKVWNSKKAYKPTTLGSYFEKKLSEIGVTKEWYYDIKKLFPLPPRCRRTPPDECKEAQDWLNKVRIWWDQ